MRAALRLAEEGCAFFGVVAELVTEDTKSTRGIAETAGDVGGGFLVDEESAQGFVLALQGELGGEEEFLVGRCRYLIIGADMHISMMLQEHFVVNMFGTARASIA